MPTRVETPGNSQVLYGVNSPFKINPTALVPQFESGEGNVLHLTRAKPEIAVALSPFQALYHGTVVEIGDFYYVSPNGMLKIFNPEEAIGIETDAEDTAEIPLGASVDSMVALMDIHLEPEPAV